MECICPSIRRLRAKSARSCGEGAALPTPDLFFNRGICRLEPGAKSVHLAGLQTRGPGFWRDQELGNPSNGKSNEVLAGGISQIPAERLVCGLAEGNRVGAIRFARERRRPRPERPRALPLRVLWNLSALTALPGGNRSGDRASPRARQVDGVGWLRAHG